MGLAELKLESIHFYTLIATKKNLVNSTLNEVTKPNTRNSTFCADFKGKNNLHSII